MDWLIILLGTIIVLTVLIDTFKTILLEKDGLIARFIFSGIWNSIIRIVRTVPQTRKSLTALAGPLMIITIVAVWIGLYILGFSLIYWPSLEHFRADNEYILHGFTKALYFSGTTATVLGYGDITPMSGIFQILSFVQAGIGFALFTGIITYLINIVTGLSDRNALALHFWAVTGQTGDGSLAVIRSVKDEEVADLRLTMQTLLDRMYKLHQKMYQNPILDLFYRSRDPKYSPEFMLRAAMDLAITSQIISSDQHYRRLARISEELGNITTNVIEHVTRQHLNKELLIRLHAPEPGVEDERRLEQIQDRLIENCPQLDLKDTNNKDILTMIYRIRIFLDDLDHFTEWKMDDKSRI